VQNFSQIRSAVSEEMRPDTQTNSKLNIPPITMRDIKKQRSASLVCFNAELTIQGAPTNDEVNTAMTDYS